MKEYRFEKADTAALRLLPWERMKEERLERVVLWHRACPVQEDWLALVNPEQTLSALARDGEELAGALWMQPSGLCGVVHFVMFRRWRADRVNLGRQAVRWIFDTWPLTALAAVFPAPYRHLYPFLRALGFTLWPERLPGACPMPLERDPARCADMRFALLCRSDVMR